MQPKTHKAYGLIVFCEQSQKFALAHNNQGFWEFPKGYPEKNDKSEIESAMREFEEETGIKRNLIVLEESVKQGELKTSYLRFGKYQKEAHYYLGYIKNEEKFIIQEQEIKNAGWFTSQQVEEKLGFLELKKLFEKVIEILKDKKKIKTID
ncbi:NUDIX hydrolase domain protein [Pseudocohnilembus persalinus]|uniref:NUDIX hydrolase domain protein n=1 Tax=Pseudocohnilembus persalinus TaxID=266149 RepID=A0A0V0QVG5_PSEPJ|nr:NUDIX hydrolase domain protein [Pseudocohnilembus persalinus]|eukprot:KRX05877.1 NUDIX hydrolase domain protein [Pseudocohnilembus persalinus]